MNDKDKEVIKEMLDKYVSMRWEQWCSLSAYGDLYYPRTRGRGIICL